MNPLKSAWQWLVGSTQQHSGQNVLARMLAASHEAYRLARRDDQRSADWQPPASSADTALYGSQPLMARRIRDQRRNVALTKRIVEALTDLIIGAGVQTFAWPFSAAEQLEVLTELAGLDDGQLGPRLHYALESDDLYQEWFDDPKQIDIAGKLSGVEMQRMALGESIQVGTSLILRVFPRDPWRLVPLAYQIVEREQLDTSKDHAADANGVRVIEGVEIDRVGRRLAYWIYNNHPFDGFATGNRSTRIPAERVIDLSVFTRPSASMGEPWLAAIGQSVMDRDSFLGAEIQSAAKAAVLCLVHELSATGLGRQLGIDDGFEDEDANGNEKVKLSNSPFAVTTLPGEKVSVVESSRPNSSAEPFMRLLDRDTAAGAGLSYFTATGDYSAASFTSTRAATLSEDGHIRPLQQWFGTQMALPMRRDFNRLAAAAGLLKTVSPAEFANNERTYQRLRSIGAGRSILDPRAEVAASDEELRLGLTTREIECARRNLHWIRVVMQQAVERRVDQMFGLERQYGTSAQNPNSNVPGQPANEPRTVEV